LVDADRFSHSPSIGFAGRHAALLLLQRALSVAGGVIFAAIVPRMMGPETYGRYSLITALAVFLALFSSLGLTNAIGRYVPGFLQRGETVQLRRFLGGLLTVRLLSSTAAAAVYLGITMGWLHEVDRVVLVTMAATVLLQGLAQYLFSLFLGFDQVASWGLGDTLRRWLSLSLVVPGFALAGLRGASIALLVTELTLICLSLRLGRFGLSLVDLRISPAAFAPYLRFGLLFFANTALLTAFQGSGEPLVRLMSGEYAQVSYFALANSVYQVAAGTFSQLPFALLPVLTRHAATGATRDVARGVDRLLTLLTIVSVTALFGAMLLGDTLVRVVIGAAYAPVAVNLPPLMLALVMLGVSSVTVVLAIVHERPGVALRASLVRLILFWVAGPPCIAWWGGSFGACIAVLAASTAHAALSACGLRDELGTSIRSAAVAAGAGAVCLPLVWLRGATIVNVILFGAFLGGYAAMLLRARVITTGEIRLVIRLARASLPAADRFRWRRPRAG
jgi:O-antigen/teichoic acid export membrane protein